MFFSIGLTAGLSKYAGASDTLDEMLKLYPHMKKHWEKMPDAFKRSGMIRGATGGGIAGTAAGGLSGASIEGTSEGAAKGALLGGLAGAGLGSVARRMVGKAEFAGTKIKSSKEIDSIIQNTILENPGQVGRSQIMDILASQATPDLEKKVLNSISQRNKVPSLLGLGIGTGTGLIAGSNI